MRSSSCLLLALGMLSLVGRSLRADEIPEKYRPAIKKGLTWLVKQQTPDGTWTVGPTNGYAVAMTSFAGLALLCEGSTTSDGAYADNLRRATDWLLKNAQKGNADDGMLVNRRDTMEGSRYLFGQGYGLLFLASVLADEEDRDRRAQLRDVLNRAVQFSVRAQSSKGGWFYTASKEGGDNDEGSVTICQIHGLRAARQAGIPVPAETLKKAFAYLAQSTTVRGGVVYSLSLLPGGQDRPGLTAGAIACSAGRPDFEDALVKKWIKSCEMRIAEPGGRLGPDDYTQFYYTQVRFILGEKGYVKLFGEAANPLLWSKYREKLFDHLMKSQKDDGSWAGQGGYGVGPIYTTALSLIEMQLDNEAVPMFSYRLDHRR
jgi:hypothetical protein